MWRTVTMGDLVRPEMRRIVCTAGRDAHRMHARRTAPPWMTMRRTECATGRCGVVRGLPEASVFSRVRDVCGLR
ncbi:hypothetical protein ACFQ2B_36465 [Streptomyces stramineus]|uniref:Uncharacterized protein n=2 Tax=Streptomyces TaxID=1883 RepID=A0ABN0ZDQ8_9ACTN